MLNIYRASAGSGKTFQLTKDYIFLLFQSLTNNPRPHRRILAVTFTNKATDEMKSRILQELHLLSSGSKSEYRADLMKEFKLTENEVNSRAGKILIRILHDYSSFSISTIDKFFQQVVRSFAREIGLSGGYNLELDTDTTLRQAVDNLYSDMSLKENEQLLSWMTDFLKEQIEDVFSCLTDRERKVLYLRFGLKDGRPRTLEEVGKIFKVTRERIRQIEVKALRKLRHPSRRKKLEDFKNF